MASINRLKPDQIVYEVRRQQMGRVKISYGALYALKIIEVDIDNQKVFASWNGNPPQWYSERSFKKWRVNKPKPKSKILGTDSY
jgi:hypothetical protein